MREELYSDLHYQLDITSEGNVKLVKNHDAIVQSIKTILATYPGERYNEPEFGSRLRDFLFEIMEDATAYFMKVEVTDSVTKWEPRIAVKGVQVVPNYDNNTYELTVRYVIRSTGETNDFSAKLKVFS